MENNLPPPKKEFPRKLILIAGGILLLIILLILAFTLFRPKGSEQAGEIVWWGLWEDNSAIQPLIDEYQAKNPKINIKYVRQSKEDYRERLTNSLAKGQGPDIFRFHNSWASMFTKELDKMPASVYSASDFAQKFYPVMVSDLTYGASIVGLPLMYDGITLYINEEIFEKSGKSVPSTWNELRQIARELTIKDERNTITQAGVALGRTENVDHWPEILGLMMLQNGVDLTKPTGKLAEDALEFFTLFSKDDGVWDTTLPSSTVAFAAGKTAMYFGPSWRAFEIRQQNPNLKFKTVPLPQLPKTEANEIDVTYASYWAEGVWTRSTKKAAAWDFLKFLSQKESLEKLYNNSSKQRMFGEIYPMTDMESLLSTHPIAGSVVNQAKYAQSWYLQSRTWDGPTGINTQINKYFEDAINAVNQGKTPDKALEPVADGVSQVLSQYGIRIR
jgi:multiple sugar transport system substrate-binding protein